MNSSFAKFVLITLFVLAIYSSTAISFVGHPMIILVYVVIGCVLSLVALFFHRIGVFDRSTAWLYAVLSGHVAGTISFITYGWQSIGRSIAESLNAHGGEQLAGEPVWSAFAAGFAFLVMSHAFVFRKETRIQILAALGAFVLTSTVGAIHFITRFR